MTQKAKPGEKTLLELVSQGKIRTSEDIPELSESKFVQKWALPLITGAEMETEDYDPGALDAAFASLGFVGGSLKTGYKLGKEAVKKVGSAYRRAVRPKLFSRKDELLRRADMESNLERLQSQLGTLSPESQGVRETIEAAATGTSRRFDIGEPYQRGTYARQVGESIESNVDEILNEINNPLTPHLPQPVMSMTREEARAIIEDIGIEGWHEYSRTARAMDPTTRAMSETNFMAKYKDAGAVSGDKALQAYKSKGFKFNVERGDKKFKWENKRRGTEHTLEQMDLGQGSTKYELKIKKIKKPGEPKYSIKGNPAVKLSFHVDEIIDDVHGEVNEIRHMSFFASGDKRADIYAGRLLNDLLDKLPENAVINEASLTFDSFYMMINQAIKKKASIVFDEGKRIPFPISPSSRGKWSKDIKNAQTVSERNEIIDGIMNEVRLKLKDYPKLEGRPKLSAEGVDIEFNRIKIHNITAAVAVALGLKNKEQLEKLFAYDPESVESQVFDSDFSI